MQLMSAVFVVIALAFYSVSLAPSDVNFNFLLEGMLFLDDVLIYIAALEILKSALIQRKLFAELDYKPAFFSYHQTRLLAMVSAFPLGLGVSSFLKGLSKDDINTKPISEGMTASMLIYPTTLASGFVFDSLQLAPSLFNLFMFGLPIIFMLFMPWPKETLAALVNSNLFRMLAVLALGNYIYLLILSQFFTHHYMLKQAAFFVLFALGINTRIISQIPQILWGARSSFFFFICVGMLGHAFIHWIAHLKIISAFAWLNVFAAMAIPIFVIPLLGIVFIHPLVLFLIFNPLLSPYLQSMGVRELNLYVIWVVMLINAQLLSPVSLTTVLSVSNSNSNSNIFTESFLKHNIYVLKISCIAYVYLMIIFNLS